MRNLPGAFLFAALAAGGAIGLAGCATETAPNGGEDTFLLGTKNLLPPELVAQLPADAVAVLDPTMIDSGTKDVTPLVVPVGAPEKAPLAQPIQFPHNTHVQKLGMDCQYCHSSARKGANAGVPSTQLCMGCHEVVPTEGRPELVKLKEYWADGKGEPIPWAKVHDIPDHAYFPHKPHVRAGVQCSECHGAVEEMGVAQRVSSLQMGWCLDCHAQHDSIDTNYGEKAELRRAELKDCYTCHK